MIFRTFSKIFKLNAYISGLHSDLFLGSTDQSSNSYDSNEELHQGMLSAVTDDIINLIMSMDVVHFKTMLDKSRSTNQEQEEELRRRQSTIGDLECKVGQVYYKNCLHRNTANELK